MPYYRQAGIIPEKRHIVFKKGDNGFYQEELVGTQGFSGMSSLVYHIHPPTLLKKIEEPILIEPKIAIEKNLRCRSFLGYHVTPDKDYIASRKTFFVNNDLHIGFAAPQNSPDYFFKNADADELIFVHQGKGILKTMFGKIPFEFGDYLIIPRGTVYQLEFENSDNRFLIVESFSPITTPKRYRNEYGQLLEQAPFCERDFKVPQNMETHDERGNFVVQIKKAGMLYRFTYETHPFDLVGWDGCNYPYAFNIKNFEPLTGRIHMPPPVHQTFEGNNFVICSFVPRLYDYHPQAIPAPYHHSNIDADEILYYVAGEFMSRNDIEPGQITIHPAGIPHGPHPGAIERSIGQKETNELAVMIDPFNPVMITEEALKYEKKEYYRSWIATQKEIAL